MKKHSFTLLQRGWAVLLTVALLFTMLSNTLIPASASVSRITELLATVDANAVTEGDAAAINEIGVLYDALDSAEQSQFTATVSDLKTKLSALLSEGYTGFTGTSDFTNQGTWGILSYTDSTARITFTTRGNVALRIGPRAAVELDGLELKFNRLYQTATADNAGFGIQLTPGSTIPANNYAADMGGKTGLLLYFDLANGKLILNLKKTTASASSTNVVYKELATDEKLQLTNLRYKAFTIGFEKTNDTANPYSVILKTADGGTTLTVNIPSDCYDESLVTSSGKVNVAFNRGYYTSTIGSPSGNVNMSFDFIGYRDMTGAQEKIEYINTTLASLDAANVSESNAAVINKLSAMYDALIPAERAQIAEAEKLTAISAALAQLVSDGYTAPTSYTSDYWTSSNWFTLSDGIAHFALNEGSLGPTKRIGFKTAVEFDGLELKFSNLQQTDSTATSAGFGLIFATTAGKEFGASATGLLLYLDAKNGNLLLNLDGKTKYKTLIEGSDVLKLGTLEYNTFTLSINASADTANPYTVTVRTADGKSVSASIPADCFSSSSVLTNGNTYVTFSRGRYDSSGNTTGSVYNSFDFIGYRDNSESSANIAWINSQLALLSVDTLTEASAAVVNRMAAIYETLIPMEKAQITDTAKLEALIAEMATLVKQGINIFSSFTSDYWPSANWFEKTADYARFTLSQTSLNPQMRIGPTEALEFDGLELKFNNLQQTDSTATTAGFGIIYALSAGYEFKPSSSGLLLYIDAKNGDLILNLNGNSKYAKLIENSDVLKLSTLEYNSFIVKTAATNDAAAPYSVTVTTADGKSVSANIPADCFDASKILTGGKTYVSISRGRYDSTGGATGSVYNRFDLVGYKNVAAIEKVNSLIASIPENITLADSGLINRTMQYYENLTDEQKSQVTGFAKLEAAVSTADALYAASLTDTDYTVLTGNENLVSKMEDMNSWWGEGFASASGGGGIRLDWANKGLDVRASLKNNVNMDGLRLKFNRLLQKGAGAEFAIYIADNAANEYNRYGEGDFALVLNATDGTLKVATGWVWNAGLTNAPTYVDIITDDLLKYESIGGGEFVIGLDKQQDGSFKVTVTVGDSSVSGTIPTTVFETVKGKLANTGECYICVSAWYPASQSLDFIGYKTVPDVYAPDVNAWIAALPEEITLDTCELLDKIYTKLLIANEEQLAAIENKDKFYTAMKAYRKLLELETDVFSYEYIALKNAANWWPSSFKCTAIENDGGLRISWKNGGRDVRQGYSKRVWLDGLKLQFNALHKTKETAAAPKLAVMLGDVAGVPWTYNNTTTTRPLAIVLDTEAGTLSAQPSGTQLVKDDKLKLENLEYELFYIELNQNDDKLWQVDVITPTGTVSGVMSTEDFTAGERFTNPDNGCFVTLTAWEPAYATIEWTGIGQSTKHHDVTKMIDNLRVVDANSEEEIKAARAAYDALPEYVQNRVANYQVLTDAEAAFLSVDKDYDPIPYVEQRISELGEIDITSKQDIDDVIELYNTLSTAQQNSLKNKATLDAAIAKYYALYAEHMDWDSCVYAPIAGDAKYSQETLDSWWNGTVKFYDLESGGIHIDMAAANRDHRISLGSFELDGLNIQLQNFKITQNTSGSGVLAISVGPNYVDYGKGFATTAKRTFVFVLDTNEGTLTLNTAGNTYFTKNLELFASDKLKYSNIEGKNFSLMFEEIDNFNYTVRFMVSDGTLLSATLPSSVMIPLMQFGTFTKCYVQVGAWDTDSNQSVELISIFDNNSQNAVSQVMPVIKAIEAMPADITLEDEQEVRAVRELYRTLLKKGLKEQVSNYAKLDWALLRLSELWDANGIDPYEFELVTEESEIESESFAAPRADLAAVPLTTEDSDSKARGTAIAFAGVLSLGGLALLSRRSKIKKEEAE